MTARPAEAPGNLFAVYRRFVTLALVLAAWTATPAQAQQGTPDYIASDNVEFIRAIKSPDGLTAGARIIGKYLYVTSAKDLEIFDISKPEDPQRVGLLTADVQFENEEVPTNGKILGISSDLAHTDVECAIGGGIPAAGGCLKLYDVRDPANVKKLPPVPGAGDHTSTCVLDCQWFYGSDGTIVDARKALDPGGKAVKLTENWKEAAQRQGVAFTASCHYLNEFRPGLLIAACNPILVLSVRPEDGGSITNPKVIARGTTPAETDRFIHSVRWPRQGQDKFALIGGETNFQPQCGPTNGAFMTFDASRAFSAGTLGAPLDEIRPVNGTYLDSNPPAQVLGCSVHWSEEHPTFRNGGLVALAEYENGTRFLQIKPDGKIVEQGYFIPLGGSTSAPHWVPGTDIVYAIDYERGIDVLRWKGQRYVPDATGAVPAEPGRVPGTEGRQPAPASSSSGARAPACVASAGFERATARPAAGGRGLRFTVARREQRPFDVDVFRTSRGRRVLREHRAARFRDRTRSFSWNGRGAGDGDYFVRFRMRLANGELDQRRFALRRAGGRFTARPAFYSRDTCGALRSFKLRRQVFGGPRADPLRIAYQLNAGVDAVSIAVVARGRTVARFPKAGTTPRRTYRLSVPARGIARATDVRVRITIRRANATVVSTLVSRRL